jgi:hypothetical protein
VIIELTNERTKLKTTFMDFYQFENDYIRPDTFQYESAVDRWNTWWLHQWPGLLSGGHGVSNGASRGANSEGTNFYANNWDDGSFTLVFEVTAFNTRAFQNLNNLKHYKNYPLKMRVFTDRWADKYVKIDDIDLEGGVITFSSALSGAYGYWDYGLITRKIYPDYFKNAVSVDPWGTSETFLDYHSYVNNPAQAYLQGDRDGVKYHESRHFELMINGYQPLVVWIDAGWNCDCYVKHVNSGVTYHFMSGGKKEIFDSIEYSHTIGGVPAELPPRWMEAWSGVNEFVIWGDYHESMPVYFKFHDYHLGIGYVPEEGVYDCPDKEKGCGCGC